MRYDPQRGYALEIKDTHIYVVARLSSPQLSRKHEIHATAIVTPEQGAVRVDVGVLTHSTLPAEPAWSSGDHVSGPNWYGSVVLDGSLPQNQDGGPFVKTVAAEVQQLLLARCRRLVRAAVGGSTELSSERNSLGVADGSSLTETITGTPLPAIPQQWITDLGTELRSHLADRETGRVTGVLLPAAEPRQAPPARVTLTIEQRDSLIDSGVMPLPKNLLPHDGLKYDTKSHSWVKE